MPWYRSVRSRSLQKNPAHIGCVSVYANLLVALCLCMCCLAQCSFKIGGSLTLVSLSIHFPLIFWSLSLVSDFQIPRPCVIATSHNLLLNSWDIAGMDFKDLVWIMTKKQSTDIFVFIVTFILFNIETEDWIKLIIIQMGYKKFANYICDLLPQFRSWMYLPKSSVRIFVLN